MAGKIKQLGGGNDIMAGKIKQLGGGNESEKVKVSEDEKMSWIGRKLFLYNVTFGLYVMDWWERYLFNSIVLAFLSFIFYGATRSMWLAFDNHFKRLLLPGSGNYSMVALS